MEISRNTIACVRLGGVAVDVFLAGRRPVVLGVHARHVGPLISPQPRGQRTPPGQILGHFRRARTGRGGGAETHRAEGLHRVPPHGRTGARLWHAAARPVLSPRRTAAEVPPRGQVRQRRRGQADAAGGKGRSREPSSSWLACAARGRRQQEEGGGGSAIEGGGGSQCSG